MFRRILTLGLLAVALSVLSPELHAQSGVANISGQWKGKGKVVTYDLATGFSLPSSVDVDVTITQAEGDSQALLTITFSGGAPVIVPAVVGLKDFVITVPGGQFAGTGHLSGKGNTKMKGIAIGVQAENFSEIKFSAKRQ